MCDKERLPELLRSWASDQMVQIHQLTVLEIADEIELLRAELEDYRWLCTVPLTIDTVANPDNLVQVWIATDPPKCYRGRTVEEAIREARKAEKKTP